MPKVGADLTPRLGEIAVPPLLLSPQSSPFIPLEAMAAMRTAVPGAELHVFAHSKHDCRYRMVALARERWRSF
ncbi:MAG TPA: hypothetical protein VHB46_01755 [Burkholderiales bacterium]|nr:hypothetical protein [Burkholderiales bacterium]